MRRAVSRDLWRGVEAGARFVIPRRLLALQQDGKRYVYNARNKPGDPSGSPPHTRDAPRVAEDPQRIVTSVGERIAELRRMRGWNQETFAEMLRCSVQYVSRVEGGTNLTIHSLARIANALGVKTVELFASPGGLPQQKERRGRPRKR